LENPLRSILPVLLVVMEDDAGCKNNQWQRGPSDQQGKTHWQ